MRDHVLVRLLDRALVQRLIWEQASQLKVGYRGGPLVPGRWSPGRRGRCPGDRVADLDCARPDGARTRLYAELGPRWAVLAPAGAAGEEIAAAARRFLGPDLVTRLVTTDGARAPRLVRPDGHLAWTGRDPAALVRLLGKVLNHPTAPVRPAAGSRETGTDIA
ncbi:aromatic-ring hydroxylase C-terminal domain-containing protein [Pseudonocardia asaccharolytica]|uniref:FAD-binding domain-containing protein n=1 Tax=Pseudonocardia asaccharolytica DSM 44247 = NBRC 16224 TaxID=1123024 RepID=A0A511CUP7_9PSEU|nr:hypothetical protein [Pseudonocardia asaccharolytica]GEL16300.1 hypothetical protein PA7_01370 [Pseudonocardia asaccharolytica DSM 44247 = NBRC 16224]